MTLPAPQADGRPPADADRRLVLLHGLALGEAVGMEVGPLDKPLVAKSDGRVVYVDHADAETLKRNWAADATVNTERIVVDAVWGQGSLRDTLRQVNWLPQGTTQVDYLIASHVVEHVPDLVTWLREVAEVLAPAGTLRLAVPDKRYTFDRLRRTSTLAEVLDAYVRRRRVPSAARILDFALNFAEVDCQRAWRGEIVDADLVRSGGGVEKALAYARAAEEEGTYFDSHCWVFTPASFAALMVELGEAGLLPLANDWMLDTRRDSNEFFAALRPEADVGVVVASWRRVLAQGQD